jgi:2-C-methyl-D-erythritol 2,4-cyclodiphosphate synthase
MRIGIGYDFHRLVPKRKLVLGGVTIPHPTGLLGHSDADVLVHAVCDALFGAAGLGDIGQHFPDTDPTYKDISSLILLSRTWALVAEQGYGIENIDTVIFAEAPKMSPFGHAMGMNMARILDIPGERINIKATTAEGMGAVGAGEGIGAMCTVLLNKRQDDIP